MDTRKAARAQMVGMPSGIYVCAMTDYGHGPVIGEHYPVRDRNEGMRVRRTVQQSYGDVVIITVK